MKNQINQTIEQLLVFIVLVVFTVAFFKTESGTMWAIGFHKSVPNSVSSSPISSALLKLKIINMTKTINFEIAKLLKEKGFYKETLYFYKLNSDSKESEWSGEVLNWNSKLYEDLEKLAAPTIAEVIMWLYEKHGIWIQVISKNTFSKISFKYEIKRYEWDNCITDSILYSSPTEAYKAVIEHCLTKII